MNRINYHNVVRNRKNRVIAIIFIISIPLFYSCVGSYQAMSLGLLDYTRGDTMKGICYAYHFNALRDFGNKLYAEKETQKNIKLVAFEMTNLSKSWINPIDNLEYYQDNKLIKPLKADSIYSSFRVNPQKYLNYLTMMVVNAYWVESSGSEINARMHLRFIPVGLFLGPIITLYNMSTVKESNIRFRKDLDKYSPYFSIDPGKQKYILISFKDISERPIQIRLIGQKNMKP